MWNDFGDNFSNVVPDLFRMVIADRLLCSNSSCRNQLTQSSRECVLLVFDSRHIMQLNCSAVTQTMVDAYLGRDFDRQNGFLACSTVDMTCVDPQESHAAACSGSLSLDMESYIIQHYPLLIDIILHSESPQRSVAWNMPQPGTLTVGRWQYDLAASSCAMVGETISHRSFSWKGASEQFSCMMRLESKSRRTHSRLLCVSRLRQDEFEQSSRSAITILNKSGTTLEKLSPKSFHMSCWPVGG